jgi:hypothetical protein
MIKGVALRFAAFAFGLGVALPVWAQSTPTNIFASPQVIEWPGHVAGGAVRLYDINGNVLGGATHPIMVQCPDGTTACFGGSGTITGTVTLGIGSALAGGFELYDGAGSNKAAINGSGQLAIQAPPSLPLPAGALGAGGNVVPVPASSGGVATKSFLVANNTTSVAVDASPGQIYGIRAFGNSGVAAYGKLYDAAQGSTTCGSGTPKQRFMIPSAAAGGGMSAPIQYGAPYATAITVCITGGIADNDTTAPAASSFIVEIDYK